MLKRIIKSKFGMSIAEASIALAVILMVSMGGITVIAAGTTSSARSDEYQYMRIAISNAYEYHLYAQSSSDVINKMDEIYKNGASMNKNGKYRYGKTGSTEFVINGSYYTLEVDVPIEKPDAYTFKATLTDKSGKVVNEYDYNKFEG